jgi:hypothetical protein
MIRFDRRESLSLSAMWALLGFILAVLTSPFKSRSRIEAENAALRHQLIVLRRRAGRRVRLTNGDRLFFVQLYLIFGTDRPRPCVLGSGKEAGSAPHAARSMLSPPLCTINEKQGWPDRSASYRRQRNVVGGCRAASRTRQGGSAPRAPPWRLRLRVAPRPTKSGK